MKLYKLTFNEYTNGLKDTISNHEKIQPFYITVENGILYVAVTKISELEWLDRYGDGIKIAEYLGGIMILDELQKPLFEAKE